MANTLIRRLYLRLAVALMFGAPFASAAMANKPGATSPGADPGGVRGHIDIPEIRTGFDTRDPSDLFDEAFDVDDDLDTVRPPMSIVVTPPPGNGLLDIYSLAPDLFPPSSDELWAPTLLPENDFLNPDLGTPTPQWAPISTIPAPGATLLLLAAGAAAGCRRRRSSRSAM